MRHQLSWYMISLATLLIAALCGGLIFLGRLGSPQTELSRSLDTQLDFFQDDMRALWQNVSTSGVHLSQDMTAILEEVLAKRGLAFERLTGDLETLTAVEDAMLEPLCQYIRQTRCSGAFVVLEAAMRADSAPDVRSGLYIQKNNAERAGNELLLFRGMAGVSKAHGVMPHRKWQQEFHTGQFPGYMACLTPDNSSLWDCCRVTELITLPGTSERAILLTVPLRGANGRVYGICGFAVNQTYFCAHYEQPSDFSRLACILTADSGDTLDVAEGLVTYTKDGSCTLPQGPLNSRELSGELRSFSGGGYAYVGRMMQIDLAGGDGDCHTLAVLIPKEDYDRAVFRDVLETAVFVFLLVFFVLACCSWFARRYLKPVHADIKRLETDAPDGAQMSFDDFSPLTATITAREQRHKAIVTSLESEKESLQSQCDESRSRLELAQADARQLATRRRGELDPADYEMFLREYRRFSEKQRLVLEDMVEGLTPQDSAEHLGYQKSTIYSYRRDIYDKLNISGKDKLQQLRLRVSLMRQEDEAWK